MSQPIGVCEFDTSLGVCAIAWTESLIHAVALPAIENDHFTLLMHQRLSGIPRVEPPDFVQRIITEIVSLFELGNRDLTFAALDFDGIPEFNRKVYDATRQIAPGKLTTYGHIAVTIGSPGAAQAVGQALGSNPFPVIVPCHRVVAAGGKIGGFSAPGGISTKLKLLNIERSSVSTMPSLFESLPLSIAPRRSRGRMGPRRT